MDIDDAQAAGFDAFALNVGAPGASWAVDAATQLFDAAIAAGGNFTLFFSFDFYQEGDITAHEDFFKDYVGRSSYLKYDDKPVVSSFSGASIGASAWESFKDDNGVYLIPNPDSDESYFDSPATFWQEWGDALDGVFTWETAWPGQSSSPSNVSDSRDKTVMDGASDAGKTYIMGLSPLQYKHCCGYDWYRTGEGNLAERMEQVLELGPEFTEVISWNDAGESHYIGNCWKESLTDEILAYSNTNSTPHSAWQPVISSFIDAYKDGATDVGAMVPRDGAQYVGAMWYRPVLKSCVDENGSDGSPSGYGAAIDALNYAIVLQSDASMYKVRLWSGGSVIAENYLGAGLNYGTVPGFTTGQQALELIDPWGEVVGTATSAEYVTDTPTDGFCDFNYKVVAVE
ncbi:glycoside hydrolase family 71 protein [Xylariaceae sp. FL1272]|nr:glycoside hydrolase family 71 protein [Xylariaceae sp. FL1272]